MNEPKINWNPFSEKIEQKSIQKLYHSEPILLKKGTLLKHWKCEDDDRLDYKWYYLEEQDGVSWPFKNNIKIEQHYETIEDIFLLPYCLPKLYKGRITRQVKPEVLIKNLLAEKVDGMITYENYTSCVKDPIFGYENLHTSIEYEIVLKNRFVKFLYENQLRK